MIKKKKKSEMKQGVLEYLMEEMFDVDESGVIEEFFFGEMAPYPMSQKEIMFVTRDNKRVRKLGIKNISQLKKEIIKIGGVVELHVGAWFPPEAKNIYYGVACRNWLCFDFDISGDEDRCAGEDGCFCEGREFCNKCFKKYLLDPAERLIQTLQQDFNYWNIRVFFSGRRGLHVWVFEEQTLALSSEQRKALVNYLQKKLGIQLDEQVTTHPKHCIRLPFSPHYGSGLHSIELNVSDFATYTKYCKGGRDEFFSYLRPSFCGFK